MAQFSDQQIARVARQAGFTGNGLVMAVAIALAESGGNTNARNVNRGGSVDRGLWQINNVYHAEVSDACAFDSLCAAGAAFTISRHGSNWTPWSTYTNGSYRRFTARANAAVAAIGSASAPPAGTPTGTNNGPSTSTTGQQPTGQTDIQLAFGVSSTSEAQQRALFWAPYRWLVAVLVMGAFFYVVSRTKAGYVALYYGEVLILFFLFATQYQFFREALLPFISKQQHETGGSTGLNPQPMSRVL